MIPFKFNKKHTWPSKENEQYGIEESKSICNDQFMNNSRYYESQHLGHECVLKPTLRKSTRIDIDEIVKPIMNNDIPLPVIRSKLNGVPPIRVETTIRKSCDFSPTIKPTMKKSKKSQYQEKC